MLLNREQYKMLNLHGIDYSELCGADRDTADYLLRCQYFAIPTSNDVWQTSTNILVCTPMGKAAITSYRRERRKNVLSIISCVVSLCALCVSIIALFQ